jgi:putative intracellular protease/amidase
MSVQGKTIAFLTSAEGIEQAELTGPWQAVEKAGGRPVLLTTSRKPDDVPAFSEKLIDAV